MRAVAHKRSWGIHTDAIVFTRRALITFIDILGTIDSLVASGTRAGVGSIDGTGVTDGIRMAGIRGARIVQMTQQTRLACRAAAIEATDTIDTGGSVKAGSLHTIIDILATVAARPTVHTDATVTAVSVRTGRSVLADRGTHCTLVDINITVASREIRRTIAAILVDPVHASAAILAQISRTIIDVLLAVLSLKTYRGKRDETIVE